MHALWFQRWYLSLADSVFAGEVYGAVGQLCLPQTGITQIILAVYQDSVGKFVDEKLLVDELVQPFYLRIGFLNVYDSHLFQGIVAADGKCLQGIVYIDSSHRDIKERAAAKNLMDAQNLMLQLAFHALFPGDTPTCEKTLDLGAFRTGQPAVFEASLPGPDEGVDQIFLLVQLSAGERTKGISGI